MDKTNKTFAEFAVKNGWKKTEAGKDGTIVYYGNMGFLITKEYQLKPVFVVGDTYFNIGFPNFYIYGEHARDIVKFTKNEQKPVQVVINTKGKIRNITTLKSYSIGFFNGLFIGLIVGFMFLIVVK